MCVYCRMTDFADRLERLYAVERFYQSVAYRFRKIDIRFLSYDLIEKGERTFLSSFNAACGAPMRRTFNVPKKEGLSNENIVKLVKIRTLLGDLNRAYLRNLDKAFIEQMQYKRKFDDQMSVMNRFIGRVFSIETGASKVLDRFPLPIETEEVRETFDYHRLDASHKSLMNAITRRNTAFLETVSWE